MSMILSCYPTPASSPVANASDVVPCLKRMPLHFPNASKRRKKTRPNLKLSHASVKLDVYSFYSCVPDMLLYSRNMDDRSSDDCDSLVSSSKCSSIVDHESAPAPVEIVAPAVTVKSSCQTAFIDSSIDYSVFKNTDNAPIVEKKGKLSKIN